MRSIHVAAAAVALAACGGHVAANDNSQSRTTTQFVLAVSIQGDGVPLEDRIAGEKTAILQDLQTWLHPPALLPQTGYLALAPYARTTLPESHGATP